MAIRSDMLTLNAANSYLGRGVLQWITRTERDSGYQLYPLDTNCDFHVSQKRGNYLVTTFGEKKQSLRVSTKASTLKNEHAKSPLHAAMDYRDRLLLDAVNSGEVRLVNAEFMEMHVILLALGGRYIKRSARGVETVEFPSKNKYSDKFEYLFPEVRVTFEERTVEVHVHTRTASGRARETKVHSEKHPSRVAQRAVAKRKGGAK